MIVLTIFIVLSKKVNKLPPQGSPILDASNTIKIALREKSFDKAKPSVLRENQRLEMYTFAQSDQYTDSYVEQVKTGLLACKVYHLLDISPVSMLIGPVLPALPLLHNLLDPDLQQPDLSSRRDGSRKHAQRLDAKLIHSLHARIHPSA